MINENKAEFQILGITRWHELGYKGKGIRIANLESCPQTYFLKDQLRPTFDYNIGTSTNTHGQKTMDCVNQVAPLAELFPLSNGTTKLLEDSLPFILKNNIHLVGASLTSTNTDEKDRLIKKCIDNGTIFIASSGNIGSKGIKGYGANPLFITVGAVHYDDERKKINLATYSSIGKELFTTSFSNLWLRDARNNDDLIASQQGTSFSRPILTGMVALVQEFFIKHTGNTLSQDQMKLFIIDHTIDLGKAGFDEEYGYGLFVLPEPDSIVISRYINTTPIEKPPIVEVPPTIEIPEEPTKEVINISNLMIIDAGHGGTDPGTSKFGYVEKELTLIISKRVKELLDSFNPTITRTTDKTIEPDDRTKMVKNNFQYCISVHLNAGKGNGTEAIYSVFSEKGKKLAEFIVNELNASADIPFRNAKTFSKTRSDGLDYYYMHRDTGNTVTVIIECLFLDNEDNIKKLNIESISQGIANGFKKYMSSITEAAPAPIIPPTAPVQIAILTYSGYLSKGSTKVNDIKALQTALKTLGYYTSTIDGIFGIGTETSVKNLQSANGLAVDGFAGQATVAKINHLLSGGISFPTSGYRKIRRFNSDVHIYEVGKNEIVDVELGKRNILETVSTIMKNKLVEGKKVKVGINCGFFDWNSNKDHLGMYIDEGLYYFQPHNAQIDFIYYKDGTTKIQNLHGYDQKVLSELQNKSNWAIGTSYSLIQYGKINLQNSEKYDHATSKNPRTLLGQNKDGTFLLVVIDGRSSGNVGVTAQQSAELMYELGCYNAVNCDGGGSSVMIVTENGIPKIKNKPSDGSERAVGSVLLVY